MPEVDPKIQELKKLRRFTGYITFSYNKSEDVFVIFFKRSFASPIISSDCMYLTEEYIKLHQVCCTLLWLTFMKGEKRNINL